jgi:hypothetical protein
VAELVGHWAKAAHLPYQRFQVSARPFMDPW